MNTQQQPMKKILVNVWNPLLQKLNIMVEDACMKRDSYLNHVLRHEANMLLTEIEEANSESAKKFISKELKAIGNFKSVNLLLEEETVERINTACTEKNIPRDAFINRVFLLLTATSDTLDALFDDDYGVIETANEVIDHYKGVPLWHFLRANMFDTITAYIEEDPFWLLRIYLSEINENADEKKTLYTTIFSSFRDSTTRKYKKTDDLVNFKGISLWGFNCVISKEVMAKNTEKLDELVKVLKLRKQSRKKDAEKITQSLKKHKENKS